ncbi:hypothetical protein KSF78_0002231 [Schistosoma japonicum]|nr:hypothetical protein KSF78_0002231 [Schistosoma japonicum]
MLSNYDRLSNCTAPIPNQSDYISRPSRLDNTPITPWVRGQVIHEGMAPIDRGYVHKNIFGRRYYTNNNNNDMKFYYSGTGGGNSGGEGYNYHGRKGGRMTNRYYYRGGQHIEQYQLKLDMNNSQYDVIETELLTEMKKVNNVDAWIKATTSSSPSTDSDFVSADISQSSTSPLNNPYCLINNERTHNEFQKLREKSKSSLNLSTQNIVVTNDQTDINENCEEEGNNDVVYVKNQRKSIEDNNNQEDYKSTNMHDYLTLVWSDPPGTLESN